MPRVMSVGRLDLNSEGLLLLTNDGALKRRLELPSTGWLRKYRVRVHGAPQDPVLERLRKGIEVDGERFRPMEVTLDRVQGANAWLTVGLREGKNREIRRAMEAVGLEVNRLIRVSYGPFQLGALEPGAVLEVRGKTLRDQLGARLIAESGADFDAPVLNSFPNRPVKAGDDAPTVSVEKSGDWVSGTRRAGGEDDRGGKPKRFEKPGDRRERVRDRWTTKAPRQDKAEEAGKPRGRANRSSNVWMAPGARPEGGKRQRTDKPATGARGKPAPGNKPSGPKKPRRG